MSTPIRHFQQNSYYHVFNRGNHKSDIFLNPYDYLRFLEKIEEYKDKCQIKVLCFCLMPNHFHLLLQQLSTEPLTKFMLSLSTSYSKYFNIKYDQVGRLYQERFRAVEVTTDEYLLYLTKYIHLNPTKLKVDITKYKWSSLNNYIDYSEWDFVEPEPILNYFSQINPKKDYLNFVLENRSDIVGIEKILID